MLVQEICPGLDIHCHAIRYGASGHDGRPVRAVWIDGEELSTTTGFEDEQLFGQLRHRYGPFIDN